MRLVQYRDKKGWLRQSYISDGEPDEAASEGIPANPPDLSEIDAEDMLREINDLLIKRGLITWRDVQKQQDGVKSTVLGVVLRKIIALYRRNDNG